MIKIKLLDLFAGIGGFRLGLERAGHECVGWVEKDKFARRSYEAIHDTGDEWTARYIRKVEPAELPEHDMLAAGFPCQSFSVAGKKSGFQDTRGTLFFEILRLAKERQPEFLLLENVRGLFSNNGGHTYATILRALGDVGYDVEWQVLNSKNFGVPQNRERVFIIGHLGGFGGRQVFPIQGEAGKDAGTGGELKQGGDREPKVARGLNTTEDGDSFCIDSNYAKGKSPNDMGSGRRTQIVEEQRAMNSGGDKRVVEWVDGPDDVNGTVRKGGRNSCKKKDNWDIVNDGVRIRKLTPKECWRLQGFPDWAFEKAAEVNSDTQLYKQAGNSVTVNVVEEIGKRIGGENNERS